MKLTIHCGCCPKEASVFFYVLGDPYAWCEQCFNHWVYREGTSSAERRIRRIKHLTKEEYLVYQVMES